MTAELDISDCTLSKTQQKDQHGRIIGHDCTLCNKLVHCETGLGLHRLVKRSFVIVEHAADNFDCPRREGNERFAIQRLVLGPSEHRGGQDDL